MLDTLYQIGQHLSNDRSRLEFDRIIATPPIDEKAKGLEFFVAEVIFDLDAGSFRLNDKPRVFDDLDITGRWSPYSLRCIKIQGGRNKNIYPTVDPRKFFDQWKKTFFGSESNNGKQPKKAELVEAIEKDFPDLVDTPLCKAVAGIFKMRDAFEEVFPEWKTVVEELNWGEKSRIAMLFASIVSTELHCPEPVPVANMEAFDTFIRRKFLQKSSGKGISDERKIEVPKICYVTGQQSEDVELPSFLREFSMNKMFVTTTKNYASGLDDKGFSKNYQASSDAQTFLERGSKYVLDNLTVRIAGVDHCILPKFLGGQDIDLEGQIPHLKSKSELLFKMTSLEFRNVVKDVRTAAIDGVYWISFLAYDTNGTFFKTINLIKDISKTHFETVIQVLRNVDTEMSELLGDQWEKAITFTKDKEKIRADFNFSTVFNFIPIRKEKDKRNAALALFKAILERRQISAGSIFQHFSALIQLHRFGRGGYNISPMSKDYFDIAIRNAVFQYLAFFQFLKKIKLLDMEEKTTSSAATLEEKNAAIAAFFERMGYSDDQRAMFYLGRILASVGFAQAEKDHKSKPILGKLNYNGIDSNDIQRLRKDLFEKCRQYTTPKKNVLGFNEMNFSKFTDLFLQKGWDKRMKPEESLFYLLSGYSFRTPKEAVEDSETVVVETEN
jgi:CRISPR-associated protein Csh1